MCSSQRKDKGDQRPGRRARWACWRLLSSSKTRAADVRFHGVARQTAADARRGHEEGTEAQRELLQVNDLGGILEGHLQTPPSS